MNGQDVQTLVKFLKYMVQKRPRNRKIVIDNTKSHVLHVQYL